MFGRNRNLTASHCRLVRIYCANPVGRLRIPSIGQSSSRELLFLGEEMIISVQGRRRLVALRRLVTREYGLQFVKSFSDILNNLVLRLLLLMHLVLNPAELYR